MLERLADAVRPGGWIVLEEPDFHPVLATDSPTLREFWEGWLVWADRHQIDYFVGRKIPGMLVAQGLSEVRSYGETILYRADRSPRDISRPRCANSRVRCGVRA